MKEEKAKSFVDELDEAVRLINYDIAEQTGFEWVFVTMLSSGDAYVVKFLDIEVWSSENDDRPYLREDGSPVDYEADDYDHSWEHHQEPISRCLRREINNGVGKVIVIKLKEE